MVNIVHFAPLLNMRRCIVCIQSLVLICIMMVICLFQKIAVVLMDTEGTFDRQSSIGGNTRIFALSTLISSVQVYVEVIHDDNQH